MNVLIKIRSCQACELEGTGEGRKAGGQGQEEPALGLPSKGVFSTMGLSASPCE